MTTSRSKTTDVPIERHGSSREVAEAVRRAITKHTKFDAWEVWGTPWHAGLRIEGRSADEPDYFIEITPVRPAGRRRWEVSDQKEER